MTGDTLFRRGIGRTDLPGGSYTEIVDSIKNKLYKLPNETVCYCGHGPETTIGEEKRNNYDITEM
jgi:glyoxylase-like metal-dependent hydrolase (beta-lactamase superfamily II)